MLSSLRQLPNLQFHWPAEYFQNIFSDEDTIIALPLRDTFPKVSETFDGETDTPGINPLVFSGRLPKRFSQKKKSLEVIHQHQAICTTGPYATQTCLSRLPEIYGK